MSATYFQKVQREKKNVGKMSTIGESNSQGERYRARCSLYDQIQQDKKLGGGRKGAKEGTPKSGAPVLACRGGSGKRGQSPPAAHTAGQESWPRLGRTQESSGTRQTRPWSGSPPNEGQDLKEADLSVSKPTWGAKGSAVTARPQGDQ